MHRPVGSTQRASLIKSHPQCRYTANYELFITSLRIYNRSTWRETPTATIVDSYRLADRVSSSWLQTGANQLADVNNDGIVNSQDIALISSSWSETTGSLGNATVPEPSALLFSLLA